MYTNAALANRILIEDGQYTEIISTENTTYHLRNMKEERRLSARYTTAEGIYAVIDSISPQICQIVNIGTEGMAFIYYSNEEFIDFQFDTLDVLVTGDGFCLENVLFEKVADYRIEEIDTCGFEKRIANIQFIDLNEDLKNKIQDFINTYVNKTVN